MEFIITFFRDILDGPLYIVVAIISVILICSCIGYLAETSLNKKKAKQEYDETHADLSEPATANNVENLNSEPTQAVETVSTSGQPPTLPPSNTTVPEVNAVQNQTQTMNPQIQSNIGMNGNVAFQQMSVPNIPTQPNVNIPPTMGAPVPLPAVATTPPAVDMPPNSVEQPPKL